MSNALPQARNGFNAGKQLFDGSVGTWQPLPLADGIIGDAEYLVSGGILVLKGTFESALDQFKNKSVTIFKAPSDLQLQSFLDGINVLRLSVSSAGYSNNGWTTLYTCTIVDNSLVLRYEDTDTQSSFGKTYLNAIQLTYAKKLGG